MHGLGTHGACLLTRLTFTYHRYFCSKNCITSQKDVYKFTGLLQQCRGSAKGIKISHARIIIRGYEQNPFVAAKLVGKYSELGNSNLENARKVFDCLVDKDVVLWNMMIQACATFGSYVEALNVYDQMCRSDVFANQYTFTFVLKACGFLKDRIMGRGIHDHVIKYGFDSDLFIGNALVAFYAKCQEIESSRKVFDEIPQKDLISWNSIISGYSSNGCVDEALMLFHALLLDESISGPDNATLVTILPVCAKAAAIQYGLWIHSYTIKIGLAVDAALGSGLIAMYGNFGRLNSARYVFDRVHGKNIVVWNAIIRCYGMHGDAQEALNLFSQFLENGLRPDGIMFLCLLSTCSHVGMVAKGREIFKQMGDYGIERGNEHYACMVDLLGRAGFLIEAVKLINAMTMQPGKDVYGALLGACKIYHNLELAKETAEKLFLLDPKNAGRYITLAKMYQDAGRLEDAATVRKALRENKIQKPLGYSSVEVDCVLHTFGVEDETHPMKVQIFETLEKLDHAMEDDFIMI